MGLSVGLSASEVDLLGLYVRSHSLGLKSADAVREEMLADLSSSTDGHGLSVGFDGIGMGSDWGDVEDKEPEGWGMEYADGVDEDVEDGSEGVDDEEGARNLFGQALMSVSPDEEEGEDEEELEEETEGWGSEDEEEEEEEEDWDSEDEDGEEASEEDWGSEEEEEETEEGWDSGDDEGSEEGEDEYEETEEGEDEYEGSEEGEDEYEETEEESEDDEGPVSEGVEEGSEEGWGSEEETEDEEEGSEDEEEESEEGWDSEDEDEEEESEEDWGSEDEKEGPEDGYSEDDEDEESEEDSEDWDEEEQEGYDDSEEEDTSAPVVAPAPVKSANPVPPTTSRVGSGYSAPVVSEPSRPKPRAKVTRTSPPSVRREEYLPSTVRAYVLKHQGVSESELLRHYSKRQIMQELNLGKIYRTGGKYGA